MKVTFLGTAAYEGFPAQWCECAICANAWEKRGKEVRRRTSYLIDDDIIVDFGPDMAWQCIDFNVDLRKIDYMLFTHAHSDHLNCEDLPMRFSPGFSQVSKTVTTIAPQAVFAKLMKTIADSMHFYKLDDLKLNINLAHHNEIIRKGELEVLPLAADHAPGTYPVVYVIGRNGKKVFIANDTGYLPAESWEALKGVKLDLAIIDTTMGLTKYIDCERGHMGGNIVVKFRDKLLELGCITPETPVIANHFSHNGGATHDDLVAFFKPHGLQVAHDGMIMDV